MIFGTADAAAAIAPWVAGGLLNGFSPEKATQKWW
jgi:hypothetical protein